MLFFYFLQKLYTFFSASTYLWRVLSKNLKEKKLNVIKNLSETRWSMRSDAVDALNSGYEEIRSALREISEDNHQLNVSLEAE